MWGAESADDRGTLLEDFILSHNLTVVNREGHGPTYEARGAQSYIDVTLASPLAESLIPRWEVRGGWLSSDHKAISFGVAGEPNGEQEAGETTGPMRYNVRKANWDLFKDAFHLKASSTLPELRLDSAEGVEEAARLLEGIIIEACEESMPRRCHRVKRNPWWNSQLSAVRKQVVRARRRLARNKNNPGLFQTAKREWSRLVRKYQKLVRKSRRSSWRKFVSGYGNEEPWGVVYKLAAGKFAPKTVTSTVECAGGRTTMSMRETAEFLLATHIPDDDPLGDTPEQADIRTQTGEMQLGTENAAPFTERMVRNAARTMKNGKAPGPDLIEVEVLKSAIKSHGDIFVRVFNACLEHSVFPRIWKVGRMVTFLKGQDKDPSQAKSYRPICLLSVVGKLLEKLIKARLEESVLREISSRQYGFRPGKSCEDAIVEMRRLVRESDAPYTVGLLFDIEGAFDNVWWPLVLRNLADLGCQRNIFSLVRNYFSDRRVYIQWGEMVVSKSATRGCPQGSVLGPDFWTVMFDSIIKAGEELSALHPNIMESVNYADDRLRVIKGSSRAALEADCQRDIDNFVSLCSAAKLTVSAKKTEAIILKRVRKPNNRAEVRRDRSLNRSKARLPDLESHPPSIKLGGQKIRFKNSVRYLGVHFDKYLKVGTHVGHIRAKIGSLFGKLSRVIGAKWGLRYDVLIKIYRSVFLPVATYAAAGWADLLTEIDKRQLETAQRQALIVVTRAYRTISYHASCVVAGAFPVRILLDESCARYQIRVGKQATIGDSTVDPGADARDDIRAKATDIWQSRYVVTIRPIAAFFPTVWDRFASSVQPNHYLTQVLTGHGRFRSYLVARGLSRESRCSCGAGRDTVQHVLLECPEFGPQRDVLLENIEVGERVWPQVASKLAVFGRNNRVLESFSRECMWMRECEELD